MRRALPAILVVLVLGAFVAGRYLRGEMGFELSPESVRAYVLGLGFVAPVIFVGLVVFRNFLLLPSMIVLTAGGLVFGVAGGTALGGLGILLSASMKFAVARGIGREWVTDRWGRTFEAFEQRVERSGLVLIGVVTAHPMGPMSAFHWVAGFTSIAWIPFAFVIAISGSIRALAYSYLGSTLLHLGSWQFWIAAALFGCVVFVPFAHPRIRVWLRS